jgi:hypothetical protein
MKSAGPLCQRRFTGALGISALPLKADLKAQRCWDGECHNRTSAPHKQHRHSITSSAMASTPGGMVSPSVLAVLRLNKKPKDRRLLEWQFRGLRSFENAIYESGHAREAFVQIRTV